MKPTSKPTAFDQPTTCPNCGERDLSARTDTEKFVYGAGKDLANLQATVQIYRCGKCGFEFTDERSSEARHDAVCRHLKVMTPKEIVALRERYQLSQTEFAELSGIGKASLARWETGLVIQNQSIDNLLYLLFKDENIEALKARYKAAPKVQPAKAVSGNIFEFKPRFQRIAVAEEPGLRDLGRSFDLFSPAMARQQ